jgi:exodeoxyribonuclease V gamma subunit
MLHLYKATNLQALADHYIQLAPSLPTNLFAKNPVITPNKMLGRWLQQQLAKSDGVSVNLEPVLPAHYTWRLMRQAFKDLPEFSDFSMDIMKFSILKVLEDASFTHDFPRLDSYLKSCTDSDRMVLAGKVSRIFDHYQVYRGDWLSHWEQSQLLNLGEDEAWQQAMWRLLTEQSGDKYRSQLEQQLIAAIENKELELPKTLCVFGVASLPMSVIKLIQALSKHCECYVFAFSASEGERIPSEIQHWHQTGIDFFSQINTGATINTLQVSSYQAESTQLRKLQSLLTGNESEFEIGNDESLLAVNCFSEMREVEALHDYLLSQFANGTALKSEDVLVVMPDLDKYAPFIRAVFGAKGDVSSHDNTGSETSVKNEIRIPYMINGNLAAAESSLINGLLELLEIPNWRFTREQIMVLSRNRLIQKRFDFSDDALDQIDSWLDEAGVRWGIDAEHKKELGLPPSPENTWRAGLDRLLLGAVLPKKVNDELPLFHDVLPVDEVEGGLTLLLSRFVKFCDLLFEWRSALKQSYSMDDWQLLLQKLLDDFFVIDELEEANHLALLELLDQLNHQTKQSDYDSALSIRSIMVLLHENIASTGRAGRLSGMVNFTNMNSLASVPFKRICLLGMNYDAWPTQQREPGFDLLQNQGAERQRIGDRNRANDERYLTLQLVLAAQQSLYISYVGRNIHNGENVPPSVLVSELLDCCAQNAISLPVHKHAIHIYSAGNYSAGSELQSHDHKWLTVAEHVGQGKKVTAPLFEQKLDVVDPIAFIEVDDLCGFFRNPQNSFLRQSLGIYIRDDTNDWLNVEPFDLADFADSNIRSISLEQTKVGKANTSMAMAKASGKLPHGLQGEILQSIEHEKVSTLVEGVEPEFLSQTLPPIVVDLHVDGVNVAGALRGLRPEGQLLLIAEKLHPWQKIQLWLKHLVLCCVDPRDIQCVTKVISLEDALVFEKVEGPELLLAEWIKAYCDGFLGPLPFFGKVSYEYAKTFAKKGDKDTSLKNAKKKWEDSYDFTKKSDRPGEGSKPANKFIYRNHSPLDSEFEELAQVLLCPLIEAEGH